MKIQDITGKEIMAGKIKCMTWNSKKQIRDWEVTSEGKVWPCCFWANGWEKRLDPQSGEAKRLAGDPKFRKQMMKDPDFNNLEKHTLDEVVNSEFYTNDVWHPGWNSEEPPWICKYECTVKDDGSTRYNILAKSKPEQDK